MSNFQLELVRPPSKLYEMIGGFWAINISGTIPSDAGERFVKFMEESGAPSRIEVYLDSHGGSVVGGMALGRELRVRQMNTHVGRRLQIVNEHNMVQVIDDNPGICYSACTLAYLGGYFRWINEKSEFGVHRFYFQDPSPEDADKAQMISASIANYVHDMGIDVEFMTLSARKSGAELYRVPHDILQRLKIVNSGSTSEEWSIQGFDGLLYVRGERYNIWGHQKILLCYIPDEMQFYLAAVFETRNRDEELAMMGHINIELNYCKIDVSNRKYMTTMHNGYFNIQIPISTSEARMVAASESAGVLMCFGPDAPTFLGISGMKIESGRHLLTGLINAYAK